MAEQIGMVKGQNLFRLTKTGISGVPYPDKAGHRRE